MTNVICADSIVQYVRAYNDLYLLSGPLPHDVVSYYINSLLVTKAWKPCVIYIPSGNVPASFTLT